MYDEASLPEKPEQPGGEIILYQTEDGRTRIQVRMGDETVWLTIAQMAELFQVDKSGISRHLKNVYDTGELLPEATVAKFATVRMEGERSVQRELEYYNLDAIISVGYRVNSIRGTQFRMWATQRLREYIIKGFTLDDERLKETGGGNYFDELLARIRDIRSSEKVFWRKVLDIYATSIDYASKTDLSRELFAIVQNKMHWAAHGHTAAEIVASRADASKPNMGLTSWIGGKPSRTDAEVAKNYLSHEELDILNRIVTMYLEFAELQALNRKPMYMRDWIAKLDDFMRLSERDILSHVGSVSRKEAIGKARKEYETFHARQIKQPSLVERHFLEAIKDVKDLKSETDKKRRPSKNGGS
jgi:hypothetical protein